MRAIAFIAVVLCALTPGCVEPLPVTFEVENGSGTDLFVQDVNESGVTPAWLRVFDGQSVELRFTGAGLCMCPCSEGSFCDVECAAPFPSVLPLNDGDVVAFDWDGVEHDGSRGCDREVAVSDPTLSVEMCAGDLTGDPATDGEFVSAVTQRCRRVDFARDAGTVRVVLD